MKYYYYSYIDELDGEQKNNVMEGCMLNTYMNFVNITFFKRISRQVYNERFEDLKDS